MVTIILPDWLVILIAIMFAVQLILELASVVIKRQLWKQKEQIRELAESILKK